MLGIEQLREWWDEFSTRADPRVDGFPLMDSILWPTGASLIYLIIVFLGPSFMKNRKAMELRNAMILYNFTMVVLSGYIFVEFFLSGWRHYSLGCEPFDKSTSPRALRMVNVYYLFFLSKFTEYLDTIIFILRKKFTQVSFLHVTHHAVIPPTVWVGVRFVPGGISSFPGLLNSLVHFLMYFYYGLAGLGPAYQKYLWWKRYMTSMQLIQFVLITVHASQFFFIQCDHHIFFACLIIWQSVFFFALFSHYWYKEYRLKRARKTA